MSVYARSATVCHFSSSEWPQHGWRVDASRRLDLVALNYGAKGHAMTDTIR
jgi:hypothetical protein